MNTSIAMPTVASTMHPLTFDETDTVALSVLPSIAFRVSDLFANAPDTTI